MVLALVGARRLMDYLFTQRDLEYLDDVMPEVVKKEIEERKNSGVEENSPDGNPVSASTATRLNLVFSLSFN